MQGALEEGRILKIDVKAQDSPLEVDCENGVLTFSKGTYFVSVNESAISDMVVSGLELAAAIIVKFEIGKDYFTKKPYHRMTLTDAERNIVFGEVVRRRKAAIEPQRHAWIVEGF